MPAAYFLLAFAIGLVVPLQAAINSQLKAMIGGSTLLATLVSFSVGTLALLLLALLTGQRLGNLSLVSKVPLWMLSGGLLGALFVFGTTLLAPRIGVAAMVSLIIAGQVVVSLAFDYFGWLHLPLREINAPRLVGAALVIVGVLLVNFGDKWFKS